MIITLKGNTAYSITLDPSVWIFDDRKIGFEAYMEGRDTTQAEDPAGNYMIPLAPFLERAEPSSSATDARLFGQDGKLKGTLSMDELKQSRLLFSIGGRQVTEDGPVHLFTGPSHPPIKGFASIVIE